MTRYERIKELCKQHGYTITGTEHALGFAKGSLCKIDKSEPNSKRLMSLAEYLDTTPEYILYGDDKTDTTPDTLDIDDEIQRLIEHLSGDKTVRWHNQEMGKDEKLALVNSLKQDKLFLDTMHK